MQYAQRARRTCPTTSRNESPVILLSIHADEASRPFRALMDSGLQHNFFRAKSLLVLPSRLRVPEDSGEIVVKCADVKPRTHWHPSLVLPYRFDAFKSS
ncbi:unnamed protein product [Peronospora belbahrii]|uniref:Uncharacterized protein n=1 Tax=Peronospora belbahrii TaxID=622444 RepID=A0AAU9KUI6_9STRA|nr:unnamed protein product [Peronospora belbahrii]